MATKTQNKLKAAKERRQKKLAIGGAVLLVVILAVQVPRTMKMLGGAESSTTASAPTATAQPSPGTPDPFAQPIATPTAAPDVLTDRNDEPEPGEGQLMSFELFDAKDPFAQQVTEQTAEAAAAASVQGAGSSSAPTPSTSAGPAPTGSSDTQTPRTTSSVSIAVNGTEETVRVSETFPAIDPTFVLVSSGSDSAKIAIAGGRLADGAGAVTLKRGRKLTLVNTADGARYELELR